ncbi:hypothetical protein GCK72_004182 [Caenorhabditis remanei]|uniref:Uncharacterized protein n=1 Tax=Caenorhabditis remanei TaxID=31234 RepID=E3MPV7_CAERE|nr:hypothetical protein GCK72_004182 [Caenorhabditis remanei]EFP06711.1 hypothetical protein CRE_12095 [Caenorhabditis remanei]KAF1764235.1 hypothetical protein GCK72_004182 [Caenorhabditis remanei]
MFSIKLLIVLVAVLSIVEAQSRYNNYKDTYYRNRAYQGYSNQYGNGNYQAYRSPYQNYYRNYYAQPPQVYGYGDKYIGNGVHVDSHGNGYVGAKDTGLYIFCASRGCVGRG